MWGANKRNSKEFLRRFVTVDETWIHWYTPETKEQSKQWTSPGERAPKNAKSVPSPGKVMATIFWDSQGVIYIDYLEKCKTVTGLYYAELLGRFAAEKGSSIMTLIHPPSPRPNWSSTMFSRFGPV